MIRSIGCAMAIAVAFVLPNASMTALGNTANGATQPSSGAPGAAPPSTHPVPPPVPLETPLPADPLTPVLYGSGYLAHPFDFSFDEHLYGAGFKAGEHVSVVARNVSAAPVTAVAAGDGTFQAELRYIWEFCGPRATRSPAPVFTATGDQGTQATLAAPEHPCPVLDRATPRVVPPVSSPGSSLPGSGVAVSGTAVASIPPPIGSGEPSGPQTFPTSTPVLQSVQLNGFGFVPGEHVTLHESGATAVPTTPSATATADEQGRITASVQVHVSYACSMSQPAVYVVATGDAGTAVISRVFWFLPLMIMCPVRGEPPVSGPDTPNLPAPQPASAQQPSSAVLAVRFQPSPARPGKVERAIVQAGSAGTVTVVVHYPAGGVKTFTEQVTTGQTTLHWKIPRHAGSGNATVDITFDPGHIVAQGSLTIH